MKVIGFTYTVFTIYNEIESQTKLSYTFTDDQEANTFKIYIDSNPNDLVCLGRPALVKILFMKEQLYAIARLLEAEQRHSSHWPSTGRVLQSKLLWGSTTYELRKQGYQGKGSFFSMEGQRRCLTCNQSIYPEQPVFTRERSSEIHYR